MKDLEKALKLEKDYKKLRLNKRLKNSFDFLGKLRKLGFKDIQDFINEKKLNYLKNIEIKEIFNNDEGINQILNSRDNGEEMIYITIPQNNNIIYIGNLDFNIDYCNDNNLPYYYMGYIGDPIVCKINDLSISLITYDRELYTFLYRLLKNYLLKNVNGIYLKCPVFGGTYDKFNNVYYSCFQVSFDINIELVNTICYKSYNEEYKGINYYNSGLTREKLINDIKLWQL